MKLTHGSFYADEVKTAPIKDAFKMIARHIENFETEPSASVKIGDIGCAVGALPNYLKSVFPDFDVIGFEYSDELLAVARQTYPHIEFHSLDVTNGEALPPGSLDIITMSGVLSMFDDAECILNNLLSWLREGGRLLIFGLFNPFDLDVYIKYKHAAEDVSDGLESGWNIVSQTSVSEILRRHGVRDFAFHEFQISVDLEQNRDDFVRSWTEKDADGNRFIVNGLNLRQPQFLLQVDV